MVYNYLDRGVAFENIMAEYFGISVDIILTALNIYENKENLMEEAVKVIWGLG